ncbi:MAG: CRTAC1 family protein, partial [Planctomyces sp.]|nr:CRTAC1 family protein [Planctomyces sp.]
ESALPAERDRLRVTLTPDVPQTLPGHNLALAYDLSNYPLPKWAHSADVDAPPGPSSANILAFAEIAAEAGLICTYDNGHDGSQPGMMVYQSIGGGIAAIDFDRDGRIDVFVPQAGGDWRPGDPPSDRSDHLFRNIGGGFQDASRWALPPDEGFGFGAAVGDVNGDGFPDVYVANARRNLLLMNQGDGTFLDATDAAGLEREEWTSCGLIADLNGDGLPDLYDVNYCEGDRPFTHLCMRTSGIPRTCIPTEFKAAPDRLLINLGDGRFQEADESAGIIDVDGRGLGVVAADFDGEPGLDLYIANDMTANFLFLNRTASPGGPPKFEERGVIAGAAYDADGRSQASMGIAADDCDGDGLLDLFVTHFFNESNTLYRQQAGSFFVDATREARLRAPSMSMLGFGTQFLDVELDGWPDLVVANGHVDDFTERDIPFRMRPQLFRNVDGEFAEVAGEELGDFFTSEQLGRGLATLDWNGDGRVDFVVSRLGEPVALVENRTPVVGRHFVASFVGRQERDAISVRIRVTAGGRTLHKQLTAGDGFECSNERRLVFGLGDAAIVDEVHVRWPNGDEQTFSQLPVDREFRFVEGRDRPLELPRP